MIKSILEYILKLFQGDTTKIAFKLKVDEEKVSRNTFNTQPNPYPLGEPTYQVDWDFIRVLEGFSLKGYVPKEENTKSNRVKSGVTVCAGFDLGQHSVKYLHSLEGLTPALISKLTPYMGLKGETAKGYLEINPLTLTERRADMLDKAVKKSKLEELERKFNEDSLGGIPFKTLSSSQQTVIMSVGFQYGSLRARTPKFWKAVTSHDWGLAVKELRNFGDAFPTRRNKEADLIALTYK